ncbi:MAG: hypothetical protein FJ265_10365 [Planctomycetes bacterium]|nr:hypothetical protein [Planctomycetota bacterium]
MRHRTGSLLLLSLAACAAGPASAERWAEVQRDRLLRLHAPRDHAATLAALRAQQPVPQGPERARPHLDQIEPARPRPIVQSARPLRLSAAVAGGSVRTSVPGTQLRDRTNAAALQLGIDGTATARRGAGLQLRALSSDDDLFLGRFVNDGVEPRRADAELRGLSAFPHLRWEVDAAGDLAVTARAGLLADWLEFDHWQADVHRSWLSIGPAVAVEPRCRVFGDAAAHLDTFVRARADAGAAWLQERHRGGSDRDATARWSAGAGVGLAGTVGSFTAELAYEFQHLGFARTDTDLYGDRARTSVQQQWLWLGCAVTF